MYGCMMDGWRRMDWKGAAFKSGNPYSLTQVHYLTLLQYVISLVQLQPISTVCCSSVLDKSLECFCALYRGKNQSFFYLFTAYWWIFRVLALTLVTDAEYLFKGPIAMRRLSVKPAGYWVIKDLVFRGHVVKFTAWQKCLGLDLLLLSTQSNAFLFWSKCSYPLQENEPWPLWERNVIDFLFWFEEGQMAWCIIRHG